MRPLNVRFWRELLFEVPLWNGSNVPNQVIDKTSHCRIGRTPLERRSGTPPHPCPNSFVPATPTTIIAIKPAWTEFTLSPKRIMPPMMTPTAPRPVQMA